MSPFPLGGTGAPLTPRHGQGVRAGPGQSGGEPVTTANAGCGRSLSGGVCSEWLPSLAPAAGVVGPDSALVAAEDPDVHEDLAVVRSWSAGSVQRARSVLS